MPRPTRKPAFAMDRDVHADAPVQPPTTESLLPKLGDLPPLPSGPSASRPAASSGHAMPPAPDRVEEAGEGDATKIRAQGSGGRQPAGQRPVDGITKIPARVPAELYRSAQPLVKGVGKPSWGQLIAWTCQDHQALVVSTVLDHSSSSSRRPRGQNIEGTAAHQVTARLDYAELQFVEQALQIAQEKAERIVTRTMVIIAALTVATRLQMDGSSQGTGQSAQESRAI